MESSSAAGLAVLALFVLWLGFWVPPRLRLRQQLVDSRVDDRFSAGLRVLAVADGGSRGPVISAGGSVPLLMTGPSTADERGEQMVHDDSGAARRPATSAVTPEVRESRLALLEERAARARRRLVLTVFMVLVSAAAWTVVALGLVGWWAGAVPSGLLLLVLVLGRVASMSARRSDARWLAERRAEQRQATQARALANGGPYAPRNRARVTGHAVRPSSLHTQMIPRVTAAQLGADRTATTGHVIGRVAVTARERTTVPAGAAADPDAGEVDRGRATIDELRVERAERAQPVEVVDPVDEVDPVGRGARATRLPYGVGGEPWEPVPVPLPTYVTKPTAAALAATSDLVLGRTATPTRRTTAAPGPSADRAADRAAADRAAAETAVADHVETQPEAAGDVCVGDEPRPRTETLGLPLEQILARRRAAG